MSSDVDRSERLLSHLVVAPGTAAGLAHRDPGWAGGRDFEELSKEELKAEAKDSVHPEWLEHQRLRQLEAEPDDAPSG